VLAGVSHLVIDEVHERDLDTDFLLTVLRELMVRPSPLPPPLHRDAQELSVSLFAPVLARICFQALFRGLCTACERKASSMCRCYDTTFAREGPGLEFPHSRSLKRAREEPRRVLTEPRGAVEPAHCAHVRHPGRQPL